jgi:hypothetical protein
MNIINLIGSAWNIFWDLICIAFALGNFLILPLAILFSACQAIGEVKGTLKKAGVFCGTVLLLGGGMLLASLALGWLDLQGIGQILVPSHYRAP